MTSFKAIKIGFLICAFTSTTSVFAASEPATRTTSTGAVFTQVTRAGFGESWMDPSGQVWGATFKDKNGAALSLTWQDAIAYCARIGGEFPAKEDFIRLREYMGAAIGSEYGYKPQVLPDLDGLSFWSKKYSSELAYAMNGHTGTIIDYDISYNYPKNFRCVTR